ncbi:SpoIIE family protein phosphatase [Solirubrobacter taibaiensis]|nr:SpoIIE family protein phosphatase [Solirubrobacter taibaiensis]
MEPTLTAAVVDVEPLLDVVPVPLVALEPASGRVLHINAAARGEFPAEPALRVARGETLTNVQYDWDTGARRRTVLVSGTTVTLGGERHVALVSFEDVTELESGRRRATVQADELEVMLDGIADAVTVQSPDLKVIYANQAARRLYDLPHDRLAEFSAESYLSDYDVFDDAGGKLDFARLPGRLALMGLTPEPVTMRSVDRRTGAVRWSRIKSTAVRDPEGGVRLAINVIEDITELKRSEEAQRFLAEASRRLACASLDYELTLAAVAEMAVPALADTCTLVLADADGVSAEVLEVLRTGVASLGPTRLVVPMMAAGRALGALTFERRARTYDTQDVLVAEDFALRAGAAVENARLYRAASEIARALQTSLLPPVLPDIPGAKLAAAYHPAGQGLEVGGDFYDVFSTREGQWYLVIGDVCGKGAEAAAVTALTRYTIRSAAARERSPAAILRWVDEAMLAQDGAGGRFCTVACVHVDVSGPVAHATVACGGHPLAVVRRADGHVELFGTPGTLLGLLGDVELPEASTELRPGDSLVLYTDGLTEARAPLHTWNEDELMAAVRSAPMNGPIGLVDSLVAGALGDRGAPRDDLAVLIAKFS